MEARSKSAPNTGLLRMTLKRQKQFRSSGRLLRQAARNGKRQAGFIMTPTAIRPIGDRPGEALNRIAISGSNLSVNRGSGRKALGGECLLHLLEIHVENGGEPCWSRPTDAIERDFARVRLVRQKLFADLQRKYDANPNASEFPVRNIAFAEPRKLVSRG